MWDSLVNHPLQTWAWGQFRAAMGVDLVRLLVSSGQTDTFGWQITFHKIPFTPLTIGYFPKGPPITDFMVNELIKLGRQKRAIFIQIEPNVTAGSRALTVNSQFLKPSHHPLFTKYTFVLDLTKSETELLGAMHPKTRYNLRLAQKHGVVVKKDNSANAFAAYLELMSETLSRQKFYAHSQLYHQRLWQKLRPSGLARLWTAKYQAKLLVAWIIFTFKDTVYYPYGASSRTEREVMAPNLLLWSIALWAKNHGYKYFDLWGALGPPADPRDPWYGFHRFKEGYRPRLVEYVGSYDLIINQPLYALYQLADRLRWFWLRLKSHV